MSAPLRKISIRGFKSIENLDGFELGNLNVLIGANGAGKSNFVDFFRMLRALPNQAFQKFVNESGGGDGFFYHGPQVTRKIIGRLSFDTSVYEFELSPTAGGGIQIARESAGLAGSDRTEELRVIGTGAMESSLSRHKDSPSAAPGVEGNARHAIYNALSRWTVYHFHDTSMLAPMRRDGSARDFDRLRSDASNLAAFLLRLSSVNPESYRFIRDAVRLIAPFFDNFLLRPQKHGGEERVRLEWRQKGSDFPFQPIHLSDGTLRFACLAAALLQPSPPPTIVIDEPELGLHPYAISVLADLIRSAAERSQVIVSTQSPTLLDYFDPEHVVVVNRCNAASTFERLDSTRLKEWLDEYSVGELWQKNVVKGGPTND